jgi:phosphoenolpyruvate carboxylase
MMAQLSATSCAAYRELVFHRPQFVEYFTKATPVR